jgi:hypothetical protein
MSNGSRGRERQNLCGGEAAPIMTMGLSAEVTAELKSMLPDWTKGLMLQYTSISTDACHLTTSVPPQNPAIQSISTTKSRHSPRCGNSHHRQLYKSYRQERNHDNPRQSRTTPAGQKWTASSTPRSGLDEPERRVWPTGLGCRASQVLGRSIRDGRDVLGHG